MQLLIYTVCIIDHTRASEDTSLRDSTRSVRYVHGFSITYDAVTRVNKCYSKSTMRILLGIVLVGCVEACDEKRFSNTVRLHV